MKRFIDYTICLTLVMLVLFNTSCTNKDLPAPEQDTISTVEPVIKTETVLTGYEIIWGMDFLPDGDLLFTEKKGQLHRYHSGNVIDISGLPTVNTNGQGGLLDIKIHPGYASNGWIYSTYAGFDANKNGVLTVIRFKLNGSAISNLETLLVASTPDTWSGHYGSRIAFDNAGMLYVSVGEGGPGTYGGATSLNMNAQNVKSEWGKVHRMTADGKVPADNPVLPGNSAPSTVFTYGHRNPQGLAYNPFTNEIWEDEHGPKGGDEINIIRKGKNYGWPLVSYGVNYDGNPVSASPEKEGVENPIHTWTPSIAPCGMAFITSDKYGAWKGNVLVGSLAFTHLTRLQISSNRITKETKMLEGVGRIRNVKQAPDGFIYVSVEGPGRILRLMPQ
jgi:glucose/arabinose dehydrogenase